MSRLYGFLLVLAAVLSPAAGSAQDGAAVSAASGEEAARQYFTDLELINQHGEPVRFFTDVLKDQVVLINFVFTHCEDACPMITEKLRTARDLLGEEIDPRVRFVSISIDPERDTPASLLKFATRYKVAGDNWVFLTGDKANIEHIVKKLGQFTPEVEAHSTLVLAGNVNKRHWVKIPPMVPPVGIAEKLRLLSEDG